VEPDVGTRRPANEIVAITAIRHLLDDAQAGPIGGGARSMSAFTIRPIARKVGGICGAAKRSDEAQRQYCQYNGTHERHPVEVNGPWSKIGSDHILKAPPGCGKVPA
jgi:hypothetical protein